MTKPRRSEADGGTPVSVSVNMNPELPQFDTGQFVAPQETGPEQQAKVKKLFGHAFEVQQFDESDAIPVGGENRFSDETNITVRGDFKNFGDFFQQAHGKTEKYNLPNLKAWLESRGIKIDEKLFAALFAFTKEYEQTYPDNPQKGESRASLYREKRGDISLIDVFKANSAECGEIAALAQAYLQHENVPSTYFSGDALWDKEMEFSEEHSFNVIRKNGKTYIYDPTNPTDTTLGKYPSIYEVEADFDKEMSSGKKRFVTAKNILSKKEAYYGVNNGTNIIPERDIV